MKASRSLKIDICLFDTKVGIQRKPQVVKSLFATSYKMYELHSKTWFCAQAKITCPCEQQISFDVIYPCPLIGDMVWNSGS